MDIMEKVKQVLSPEMYEELEDYIHSNCMNQYWEGYEEGYRVCDNEWLDNEGRM